MRSHDWKTLEESLMGMFKEANTKCEQLYQLLTESNQQLLEANQRCEMLSLISISAVKMLSLSSSCG